MALSEIDIKELDGPDLSTIPLLRRFELNVVLEDDIKSLKAKAAPLEEKIKNLIKQQKKTKDNAAQFKKIQTEVNTLKSELKDINDELSIRERVHNKLNP